MKLRKSRPEPAPAPIPQARTGRRADLTVVPGGMRIGERIVDAGLASAEQVIAALTAADGRPLGEALAAAGAVSEWDITQLVASQFGAAITDLRTVSPEPAAAELLDEESARAYTALPLHLDGDILAVVTAAPTETVLAALAAATGKRITATVAAPADIERAIGGTYRALAGIASRVREFEAKDLQLKDAVRAETASASDDAPAVQVVQLLITQALRDRASDIHIEPSADRLRVRYRIDGALHDAADLPGSMAPVVASRIKILAGMNIVERRRAQDGQISMDVEGRAVDIRVSTTAVVGGEKVVMRVLDKSRPLYQLEQLGMGPEMTARYSALLRSPYGMVICAGPTGAGKTTTLYGSLGEINSPDRNIMTIEDPVEYTFPTINQIQINEAAGVTFAGGLKSILRQDPDVILVGEIRDAETARIAVQSALTGHFVLSSLHATDAPLALHRLLDMGIEPFLVASSVTTVLCQRLVRRLCRHCTEPYWPTPQELTVLDGLGGRAPEGGFVRGAGCNFCAQTGYLERIGVYEMMPVSDAIRDLILRRGSHDDIRKVARDEGMQTLQEQAARLVESGVTTITEVLRSIYVLES